MRRGIRKAGRFWGLAALLSLILVGWRFFDASLQTEKPKSFSFLDRHWALLKQEFQHSTKMDWGLVSNKLHILEIRKSNAADIWLDEIGLQKLAERLLPLEIPILVNLDPQKVASSKALAPLLKKQNFIRPVGIQPDSESSLEIEEKLAHSIIQIPEKLSKPLKIIPANESYFEENHRYATLNYLVNQESQSAQFIASFPLSLRASSYYLPSAALSLANALGFCEKSLFQRTAANKLRCVGSSKKLADPLNLQFYREKIKRYNLQTLPSSLTGALLVEVVSPTSYISSAMSQNITWADLVGTAVSNIIEDHLLSSTLYTQLLELLVFLALAFGLYLCAQQSRLKAFISWAGLALIAYVFIDLLLSIGFQFETQPIEGFFALVIIALTGTSQRAIEDFEERKLVERAFSGYVSEERLHRLLSGADKLDLIGKEREMTTLLIDIVGFSKISKELSAQETFAFVQKFFASIDPLIFKFGGTIDKKTGDGLLAFFGDYSSADRPADAALSAVRSALEIQDELKRIQAQTKDYFGNSGELKCRIGINSGKMMIGNAGSQQHFNYTVLGDSVNFTQRLEAACPAGSVLVGPNCYELIATQFECEKISIQVKNEETESRAFLVKAPA